MATEQGVIAVIRASRPSFRGAPDKVAYALHSSFLAAGYILNAAGPPAFADDALSSPSTDEVGIDGWNSFGDNYAFVYSNPEKGSKKILVKCLVMNDNLLVDALRDGDSEPLHLEINVKDYATDDVGNNYSAHFKDLGKLVTSINKEILDKLSRSTSSSSKISGSSSETRGTRADSHQPNVVVTEPQPYDPSRLVVPPVYPGIGGNDLFPGPGAGMYPSRGDFGSGGGSLVGPGHPLFGGGIGGRQPGFPGTQPGFPGTQPIPPGAHFDPIGPPDVPGFEPNRFVARNPRRPRGAHPDLEHFGGDDFI